MVVSQFMICVDITRDPSLVSQHNALTLAEDVEITILSSNLANVSMIGEWGFSALAEGSMVECVLFDSGDYPDTVLRNAEGSWMSI